VRDEDGNILRIELAEEDEEMPEIDHRDKDMEELAPEVEPQLHSKWVTGLGGGKKAKGVVEGEPDHTILICFRAFLNVHAIRGSVNMVAGRSWCAPVLVCTGVDSSGA
jgi:hypothetical protein